MTANEGAGHVRYPFRAGNYKSDSESLGRSDTQNGVYYFHSPQVGLSRFSSAVIETSSDFYVAKLIQRHANVVSLLLKNGYEEAEKNHSIPVN